METFLDTFPIIGNFPTGFSNHWKKAVRAGIASLLLAAGACRAGEEAAAPEGYVNFSFDQVDLRVLAKLVGRETGRQFVLDDKVEGKITLVTPPQIPLDEVYPLFLTILESSGYTVVREGPIERVVPLQSEQTGLAPVSSADGPPLPAGGLVTRVFQLKHISAVDLARTLEPMLGGPKSGRLSAFGPSNHLIVTDTTRRMARVEQIIAQLDVAGLSRSVEVIPLQHAGAEDVAAQLAAAMQGYGSSGNRLSQHVQQAASGMASMPADVTVVAAAHANSLVVVGTPVQIAEIKQIILQLDQESATGQGPLNAVFLQYLNAEESAKMLNALLEKKIAQTDRKRIGIEADIANNALLIDAGPRDFEWLRSLVMQLDRAPDQVMVEVLIAEVSLGKGLNLGVEWSTIELPSADGNATFVGRSRPDSSDTIADYLAKGLFPQGVTLGVAKGMYTDASGNQVPLMPFLISALAQNDDVKILSSIPLWAQNNKEATVSVVKNIPLLTSTIDKGSGTASDTIQNIERKDVGIMLTVTPRVNPNREITLELHPVIEAVTDEGEKGKYTPTFAKREVQTTVTVPDQTTIAITGLIREDTVQRISKVPLLGDIPFIGALFRKKSSNVERTNLLIFVTPHLVTDIQEARLMKQALEHKTDLVSSATNVAVQTQFEPPPKMDEQP